MTYNMIVIKTNNFSTVGFYESCATTIFDNNAYVVIKRCREINGSLGSVSFDLTYHISLKQHDYSVKVLSDFNTHVLYEIVIASRITFLFYWCRLSLPLIIFSFLSFNAITTIQRVHQIYGLICTLNYARKILRRSVKYYVL